MIIGSSIKYRINVNLLQKLINQIGKKIAQETDDAIIGELLKGNYK